MLVAQETVDALGHTYATDAAKAPTCTETGLTEGKHCSVCSTVLVEQEIVDALGHTEVVDNAKAPTCTETGLTEGMHCSICSTVLVKQEIVDALGHAEVVDKAVEATDTSDGLTEGKHCEVCGEILVAQQIIPATLQGTAIKSELLTVEGDRIYGSVSNTTTIFSFLNDITVNDNATYVLARDIGCENTIASKTVTLNVGDNTFYIFVTNGKAQKLYTVTVRRFPTYTVSFNTNGGTALDSLIIEEGSSISAPITEKAGYNLDGWTVDGKFVSFPYTVTENVEFDAVFSPIVYDITYELGGGVNAEGNLDSYTIKTNTITLGSPTRDYYDFCGWYNNAEFTGEAITQIAHGSIGDINLYAKWTPTVYEIKYNLNGGENDEGNPVSYTIESDTVIFKNPTRTGYTFKGWFTDEECTEGITKISHGSHGHFEIYAKWEIVVYDIDYVLNGGTNAETNPVRYTIESETIVFVSPSRIGYTFDGWYVDSEFTQSITNIEAGSYGEVALYAKWSVITYNITYNLNGGEDNTSTITSYTIESGDINLIAPTKVGYTFIGWSYEGQREPTKTVTISTGSYGEKEFTANWQANTYTVSFVAENGETIYEPTTVTYDSAFILPTLPHREYYEPCWYNGDIKFTDGTWSIASDVILTAKYESIFKVSNGALMGITEYGKSNYTSIEIPTMVDDASIGYIGKSAFSGCSSLVSVIISDGITSISDGAFSGCYNLVNIAIPTSIRYIGYDAFTGCTSLEAVYIEDIAAWCNITFRQYVESRNKYGANPLYYAKKLYLDGELITELVIPDGVTEITSYEFSCENLISVTIPDSVTSIEAFSFAGCSSLENITLPFIGASKSVSSTSSTRLFGYIFGTESYEGGASTEQYVGYRETCIYYIPISLKSVTITGGNVFGAAFYNCSNLKSITLPESISSIDYSTFYGCSSLTNVTIPSSVTSIGSSAFYGCSSLTSVTISSSVTSIGSSAFYGCSSLTSVTIPNSITSIADSAFRACSSLVSITLPSTVTRICDYAFYGCIALTSITISDSITSIGEYAFCYCTSLTSVIIPDSVTSIGSNAFNSCTALNSFVVGEGVTSLPTFLEGCTSLESITLPFVGESRDATSYKAHLGYIFGYSYTSTTYTSVINKCHYYYIGNGGVAYCYTYNIPSNLKNVILSDGAIAIGESAFVKCSNLTSVTISNSVTSIGGYAFSGCSSFTSVYYHGTESEWSAISIGRDNTSLTNATRYYYSEAEPSLNADGTAYDGNYWYYDENGKIAIWGS